MATPMTYYYPALPRHAENSLNRAIEGGIITVDDATLIRLYTEDRISLDHISQRHANRLVYLYVTWRRFIRTPFRDLSIGDVYTGIEALKAGESRNGRPFKPNTVIDQVFVLRKFLLWMSEKQYTRIPAKEINSLYTPQKRGVVRGEEELLTREEVMAVVNAGKSGLEQALIMLLYEGGFRVGEIIHLAWKDLVFTTEGVSIQVRSPGYADRYVRVIRSERYLRSWNGDDTMPAGDALVFVNKFGEPFTCEACARRIQLIVDRTGISRHVTPGLFRQSRVAHLIEDGMREGVVTMMMWGGPATPVKGTHFQLTDADIDAEIARLYGVTGLATIAGMDQAGPLMCVSDPGTGRSGKKIVPNCSLYPSSGRVYDTG